jgi:Ca2+/Na+ antiporter
MILVKCPGFCRKNYELPKNLPVFQTVFLKPFWLAGHSNIIAFIVSLMKLSTQIKNSTAMQKVQTLSGNQTNMIKESSAINDTTANETISTKLNKTTATTPKHNETQTDLDVLIVSLFWLIVPIILILFAILAMISWAIYNKYFKYSLNHPRRN